MSLTLRSLRPDDEAACRALHRELARENFDFLLAQGEWLAIMRHHAECEAGVNLPQGFVPSSFRVAEVDGEIVGRVSIRHELNDYLQTFGGHVGYAVGPAYRRRGYATEILRQSVNFLRAKGTDRILVTCRDVNHASAAVIESCGGVLENTVHNGQTLIRRYWIT